VYHDVANNSIDMSQDVGLTISPEPLAFNCRLLSRISRNTPIILHHLSLTKLAKEILIVCDDDQLKVGMILPLVNDVDKALGECIDVFHIKSICWFKLR